MNIIIEGPDASGKSTLALFLSSFLRMPVVTSPGPVKTEEEMCNRAERYLKMDRTIFDRHPCVSEVIYGAVRGKTLIPARYLTRFDLSKKVVIYSACRFTHHNLKAHDTEEHRLMLQSKAEFIRCEYDRWAMRFADIIYRDYTDQARIHNFLKGLLP